MLSTFFDHLVGEFSILQQQSDYSQLSRRLLDFTVEFNVDKELKQSIFEYRKLYLNSEYASESKESNTTLLKERALVITNLIETNKQLIIANSNYKESTTNIAFSSKQLSKRFTSGNSPFYLQPVDVELQFGKITGIVGENGNGKTTLLRIIAGQLMSDSGSISYPALDEISNSWYNSKNQFAFIPQRIPKWYGSLIDNLRFFATIHGIKNNDNDNQINYILFRLGLDKYKDLTWDEISSGYRLRFELAKMLMWRPKLLILDEPLANLDINAQQVFLQDLKFIVKSLRHPLSIVLSSQALHEIESISDSIIFIKQGKTIYNGLQVEFAKERTTNTFEVFGHFTREQLSICMQNWDPIKIEDSGTVFIITTPVNVTTDNFLSVLLSNKLPITYFRDISTSTRKLFQKDI